MSLDQIKSESDEGFEHRLKIQKAVFLLKHFGVKPFTSYDFNLYLHGPYSPKLAEDYYNISETTKPAEVRLDDDKKKLLYWFIDHDCRWLEVATSIISLNERYGKLSNDEIYSILRVSKSWLEKAEFEKIKRELEEHGL
ncbi:MAG: hypothetical protein QXX33_01205 [Candidatus Hadarchaeales archaeon]